MLPPLSQSTDLRVVAETSAHVTGPSRAALLRSAASPQDADPGGSVRLRRASGSKPSPPATYNTSTINVSPRCSTFRPTPPPSDTRNSRNPAPTSSALKTVEAISRIPREFFVVETNAVLPQSQYPPTMHQSTFCVGTGMWETIVFPALTPRARQQVTLLRQALNQMRTQLTTSTASTDVPGSLAVDEAVAYTEKEVALHSLCFHELARQMKYICKEQSELLYEIHSVYDASVARLLVLLRSLHDKNEEMKSRIQFLTKHVQPDIIQQEASATSDEQKRTSTTCESCLKRHSRRRQTGDDADADLSDPLFELYEDDEDDKDDNDSAWRAYQRRRCMRLRMLTGGNNDDDDDDDTASGRIRRVSVVEENMAAARVQQAFQKYQRRKEAHRALQREEKALAALDIQRSYRGYRERQKALHRRAVVQVILKRRKEIAAVQLLQMNVRAYLIKKRREQRRGTAESHPDTAQASMLEAQRVASMDKSSEKVVDDIVSTKRSGDMPVADQDAGIGEQNHHPGDPNNDRFVHLMTRLSELAAAFAFLHSRRRQPVAKQVIEPSPAMPQVSQSDGKNKPSDQDEESTHVTLATTSPCVEIDPSSVDSKAREVYNADDDQVILQNALRRAEELLESFRVAIRDVAGVVSGGLTKATSTRTLISSEKVDGLEMEELESLPDGAGTNTFLFVDDDGVGTDPERDQECTGNRPWMSDRVEVTEAVDDCGDRADATHLDDVLWQTACFSPRSVEELEDEAAARRLLIRELMGSRDQQKRHAGLKQFIGDIYDTLVGRVRALDSVRLQRLIQIHASLALSFADSRRFLRYARSDVRRSSVVSHYEPVAAFVGQIDLMELVREHFHCRLGLKHLVDAAVDRLQTDLRTFMGLDPDVQRFHDFLSRERSMDELVFFCLCRLLANGSTTSRQPVFARDTMRELIDVDHSLAVARALFFCGGDDGTLLAADAVVIEPTNEIYKKHLPSCGLHQLESILRNFVSTADVVPRQSEWDDGRDWALVRATNVNHFHAKEYNTSAPRSPLVRHSCESPRACSKGSSAWVHFDELVDLLRRYHRVMRHFHAFVHWTLELFHDAALSQRSQQDRQTQEAAADVAPLLEEATFVETLLPYSLKATERELRNVFHNALKQRRLQRLMPLRVFVSLVLVLLRNGLVSVTSYRPLQPLPQQQHAISKDTTPIARLRHQRDERQWLQLALQWRGYENRFEAVLERMYGAAAHANPAAPLPIASQLLQWRNELYELFMCRSGRESLLQAQSLYERLVEGIEGNEAPSTCAVGPLDATLRHKDDGEAAPLASAAGSPLDASEHGSPREGSSW